MKGEFIKMNNFDFETIVPSPKTAAECPERYFIKDAQDARNHGLAYEGEKPWLNWHDWNRDNWGTKRNAYDTNCCDLDESFPEESDDEEVEFIISFNTAWCPPMPIFENLIKLHPELKISCFYIEEGMGFCGVYSKDKKEYYDCENDIDGYRQCVIDNDYFDEEYFEEYDRECAKDEKD